MKRLVFGTPTRGREIEWLIQCMRKIEHATREDAEATVGDFTVGGSKLDGGFDPANDAVRTINADSSDAATVRKVLATFLHDIKQRGQHRNG